MRRVLWLVLAGRISCRLFLASLLPLCYGSFSQAELSVNTGQIILIFNWRILYPPFHRTIPSSIRARTFSCIYTINHNQIGHYGVECVESRVGCRGPTGSHGAVDDELFFLQTLDKISLIEMYQQKHGTFLEASKTVLALKKNCRLQNSFLVQRYWVDEFSQSWLFKHHGRGRRSSE